MAQISVAEAARRLGVGVSRVHQRIAEGSLSAARVGSQWVLEESALLSAAESRSPGRPLSQRSAWALVGVSQGDREALDALAPAERSRARSRLAGLLAFLSEEAGSLEEESHKVALSLRSLLRNRAERRLYVASPRDLPDLRQDERVTLSGLSHPHSGIASGDLVEGYVNLDDLDDLVDEYLLSEASSSRGSNVVLHVMASNSRQAGSGVAPLLLAVDLAEHRGPREEFRALEVLREVAEGQKRARKLDKVPA